MRYAAWAKPHLPGNARLSTVEDAQQNLRIAFERGENFLRLAALLAALLSGIAVALAAQRFARRKTDEVALLRCLGASRREILSALTLELAMLAMPACVLGLLLGLGLQQAAFVFARDLLARRAAVDAVRARRCGVGDCDRGAVRIRPAAAAAPARCRTGARFPARPGDPPASLRCALPAAVAGRRRLALAGKRQRKLAGILAGGLGAVALASLLLGLLLLGIVASVGAAPAGRMAIRHRESRATARADPDPGRCARHEPDRAGLARRRRPVAARSLARRSAGGYAELFRCSTCSRTSAREFNNALARSARTTSTCCRWPSASSSRSMAAAARRGLSPKIARRQLDRWRDSDFVERSASAVERVIEGSWFPAHPANRRALGRQELGRDCSTSSSAIRMTLKVGEQRISPQRSPASARSTGIHSGSTFS